MQPEFSNPARDGRTFLSSRTGLIWLVGLLPSHKWLGYFPARFIVSLVASRNRTLASALELNGEINQINAGVGTIPRVAQPLEIVAKQEFVHGFVNGSDKKCCLKMQVRLASRG